MDLEVSPEQPDCVVVALAEALNVVAPPPPDPWWQAGLDEALRT